MEERKDECEHCKYWREESNGDGECRRRAPSSRLVFAGEPVEGTESEALVYWPLTSHEDWCGEFEAKRVLL